MIFSLFFFLHESLHTDVDILLNKTHIILKVVLGSSAQSDAYVDSLRCSKSHLES